VPRSVHLQQHVGHRAPSRPNSGVRTGPARGERSADALAPRRRGCLPGCVSSRGDPQKPGCSVVRHLRGSSAPRRAYVLRNLPLRHARHRSEQARRKLIAQAARRRSVLRSTSNYQIEMCALRHIRNIDDVPRSMQ
jgi:hypothetical protein